MTPPYISSLYKILCDIMTKYRVTYINNESKDVELVDLIDIAANKPEDALRKLNQKTNLIILDILR